MRRPAVDTARVDFEPGSDEVAAPPAPAEAPAPGNQNGEAAPPAPVPGRIHDGTFTMNIEPDGTAHLEDDPNFQFHGLGGSFDLTDAFMRDQGQDPYASEKLKALDATREQRFEQGERYKHEQLATSDALALQNLEEMWVRTKTLAERKQALFEMWDECAETGPADLVAAGHAARRTIVAFIRARLAGRDAYTPDELVRLNAQKTSAERFAPYGGG
jgi:hypothetical protein